VRETIVAGLVLLEHGADHCALLGVTPDASIDAIRSAYVALACQLHPSKLPALDPLTTLDAQRLFGAINLAFGVLSDPVRRAEYTAALRAPKTTQPAPPPVVVTPAALADEAFHRGVLALRREDLEQALAELTRATELAPQDVDYQAMLAWARFCAAFDKQAIASDTRKTLDKAIRKSPRPMMARFYLGRVERMLGRVREALYHFREVLEIEPGHTDAATEVRLLEQRAAANERARR
jgi:curved DNA-binding protein CbpA